MKLIKYLLTLVAMFILQMSSGILVIYINDFYIHASDIKAGIIIGYACCCLLFATFYITNRIFK